jgi:hypothetical protein
MQLGYLKPFSFQIGPRSEPKVIEPKVIEPKVAGPTITGVRHGVTEIQLSDGRLVRATLHVRSVKADPSKSGNVEVSYNVVAEVMAAPANPIHDVHETVQ